MSWSGLFVGRVILYLGIDNIYQGEFDLGARGGIVTAEDSPVYFWFITGLWIVVGGVVIHGSIKGD